MKEKKMFSMETGLATDLQPVIKCNPLTYDMLIQECRNLIIGITANGSDMEKRKKLKAFVMAYPAISVLSEHPKFDEL